MKISYLTYLLIIFSLFSIKACDLLDKEEPIPAFIAINELKLVTDPDEGTDIQQFDDAWVYLDGKLIGIMEVPGELPALDSGEHDISIFAGVRLNGISSSPDIYYVCDRQDFTVDLVPGEVVQLSPVFRYSKNTRFLLIEDFESNLQLTDDLDGDAATSVVRVQSGAFEGNFSGKISLDTSNSYIEVGTTNKFDDIPSNVAEVYLEIQYRNDIEFSIGLQSINEGFPPASLYLVGLRPTESWKKVYVRLTDLVRESGSEAYKLIFQANNTTDSEDVEIYLDNIKLLLLD